MILIDRLDHSASPPASDRLLSFVQNIARLTLFAESDYVTDRPEGTDPEAVQTDLDWLIAQDETLESLIREARALTGIGNHPPFPQELNPDGITLTDQTEEDRANPISKGEDPHA